MTKLNVRQVKPSSFLKGSATEFIASPLDFVVNSFAEYGDTFRVRAGPKHIYIFSHPNDIKVIFQQGDDVLVKERGPRIVLGESLLTSEGPTWNRQKEYVKSYFSKPLLESMIPKMRNIIVDELSQRKGAVDLHAMSISIFYRLVMKVIFGLDNIEELPNLWDKIDHMTHFVRKRPSQLFKPPIWIPFPSHIKFSRAKKNFFLTVQEIVDMAERSGNENLISALRKDPEATNEEILNQALTFFVASFETTANALFWTLYLLTKDPERMEKIKAECQAFHPDSDNLTNYFQLKYTMAVINESMRLYPPAWFRSRLCAKSFYVNEHFVPKGATVWASIYLTQRHPEIWSEPNEFRPERFLTDNYSKNAFIPFGGGKNLCPGKQLATLELLMILAELFKSKEVSADRSQEVKPKAEITLNPDRKFMINLD